MGLEVRACFKDVDLRMAEGDRPQIDGHFARYNTPSVPLWGDMREIIRPGAFDRILRDPPEPEGDTRALLNHDRAWVLGRRSSGTLALFSDEIGLRAVVDAPDTQTHRDLIYTPMARGDVNQASFAFRAAEGGAGIVTERGESMREVSEVELLRDVSVLTMDPAYEESEVWLRSLLSGGLTPDHIRGMLVELKGQSERTPTYPRRRLAEARLAAATE